MGPIHCAYLLTALVLQLGVSVQDNSPGTVLDSCNIQDDSGYSQECSFNKLRTGEVWWPKQDEFLRCNLPEFEDSDYVLDKHQKKELVYHNEDTTSPPISETTIIMPYTSLKELGGLIILLGTPQISCQIVCWAISIPQEIDHIPGQINLHFKNTTEADVWKFSYAFQNYSTRLCEVAVEYNMYLFPIKRSVLFTVTLNMTSTAIIELYSGNCSTFTCNGSRNDCTMAVHNQIRHIIKDQVTEVDFPDLSENYYCVIIGFPCLSECVPRQTKTYVMESLQPLPTPEETPLSWTVIISAAIFCVTIILLLWLVLRFVLKWLNSKRQYGRQNTLDIMLNSDSSSDSLYSSPRAILVLYSRDSAMLCEVISAFRRLLETYANVTIHDPFDESQIEEVSRNVSGWVTSQMNDPSVRIILIISEGAALRQQAMLKGSQLVSKDPHSLDSTFTLALRHLHDNPLLSQDYTRIFPVRFEDFTSEDVNLTIITPHKRFILMKHYEKLISELLGINIDTIQDGLQRECKTEYTNLQQALQNMKQFVDKNPNFLQQQYIVND